MNASSRQEPHRAESTAAEGIKRPFPARALRTKPSGANTRWAELRKIGPEGRRAADTQDAK
jgi:hypothetical protein